MMRHEQVRFEAAQWFLDVRDADDPSPELLLEWVRWMDASEAHRQAFIAVEQDWKAAAGMVPAAVISAAVHGIADDSDYDGSISVEEWRRRTSVPMAVPAAGPYWSSGAWRRHRRWVLAAVAAGAVLAAVMVFPAGNGLRTWLSGETQYSTGVGQHVEITLQDGSQVNLGARSQLSVHYSRSSRDLTLARGEAFFAVQKDAGRPFRVRVLSAVVTAVGTAFDVRASNDRGVVTVTEGTVQLADHAGPVAKITRGESASFVNHAETSSFDDLKVMRVDPARAVGWREGWLVYRDEPLRDVLADVSRYTDQDIVIAPGAALNVRFTGAVSEDSTLEWLHSLPGAFAVKVTAEGDHIAIAAADTGSVATRP